MIERVAYLSMHTSPLHQPGTGDAGGMNVYLDRLSRTMAGRGVDATVFTRRADTDTPLVTEVVPGYRVVQIDAGPRERLPVASMVPLAPEFSHNLLAWIEERSATFDIVHSHYWLSGRAGVRVRDRLGIPLANSFHTLGKVKDAVAPRDEGTSSRERLLTEEEVIANSDCVIASTPFEFDDLLEHYGASPERLCVSPPGVDHDVFAPGDRSEARRRLGFGDEPIVLYVGRVQPHKGTALAVRAFSLLTGAPPNGSQASGSAILNIVGGSSGPEGDDEMSTCHEIIRRDRLGDRVRFIPPVPHAALADHYRAADVVIVPSRTESFGLVAAEAQACGIPVVAANTGGLPYVVNASESGLLVDGRDAAPYAAAIGAILEHRSFAERLSRGAVAFSQKFSWEATANRLLELYDGIRG